MSVKNLCKEYYFQGDTKGDTVRDLTIYNLNINSTITRYT
jgi:hypothetical protein